jgi:hypothetical protein
VGTWVSWASRIAGALLVLALAAHPALAAHAPAGSSNHPSIGDTAAAQPDATAADRISPGQTKIFTASDGGSTSCLGLALNPIALPLPDSSSSVCLLPRYGVNLNSNDPSTNFVSVFTFLTGVGIPALIPAQATSIVYKDITVEGPGSGIVDAQVSVSFDYIGDIVGVSLYRNALSLSLQIDDLTNGAPVGTLASTTMTGTATRARPMCPAPPRSSPPPTAVASKWRCAGGTRTASRSSSRPIRSDSAPPGERRSGRRSR